MPSAVGIDESLDVLCIIARGVPGSPKASPHSVACWTLNGEVEPHARGLSTVSVPPDPITVSSAPRERGLHVNAAIGQHVVR